MTDPMITLHDLTAGYGRHPAVHHLSGTFPKGAATAIIGPNGSGKSTLIKTVAGLLRPMSGTCRIAKGTTVAYLPQQSELDRGFPAQVRDVVAMGLWRTHGLLRRHRAADRDRIAAALHAVGLDGFGSRPIDSLSGGQLQRTLFARVLVQQADLILLDEPFNAIDEATIRDLLALIHGWCAQGQTVVIVAHDMDLVRAEFPHTLMLARRAIAWGPTETTLTPANLRRARALPEAWDDHAPWCAA